MKENQYIAAFVANRRAVRRRRWIISAMMLCLGVNIGNFLFGRHIRQEVAVARETRATTTVFRGSSGGPLFFTNGDPQVIMDLSGDGEEGITEDDARMALWKAVHAWRLELGDVRLPKLAFGMCASPMSIACADPVAYRIIVAGWMGDQSHNKNLETILMHEVGHLLGVPHIARDPLMDAGYQGEVLIKPTPAAVALAKLARKEKP